MAHSLPLIHRVYARIFKVWRVKRLNLFIKLLKPQLTDRILDVGGYPLNWTTREPLVGSIDSLNIHPVEWDESSYPEHHITTLVGDGCKLTMADKSYDLGFSNSVIEHVGPWENQVAFAKEIRRVGDALWVQTPAYECPIEPHYLAPFIHWLPKSLQRKVIPYFSGWGWLSRPSRAEIDEMVEYTRLITRKEMGVLFPDCEIYTERLLWILPKSYIAIRKKQSERGV